MKATDAKKAADDAFSAEIAKKNAEEVKKQTTDTEHLLNHFYQLIKRASNQGKFAIEKVSFAQDRFRAKVIDEVVDELKEKGYKVNMSQQNALQLIVFEISWG